MADPKRTLEKTMRSKAALDAARNLKKFYELINSGVDPMTAFLQVFMGIYYLVPPEPPHPDYFMSINELHGALKEALTYFSQMKDETKEEIEFMETLLKHPINK